MDQLRLVGSRHHHHARQAAEIGNIVRPGMGRTIGTHEAGPIEGEANRKALDRHVVHDLVVGALQESRINRTERLVALGCEAGGKGDPMLLGDAHVEGAIGKMLGKKVQARARGHGGGNGDDLVVVLGLLDQGFGEDLRIARSIGNGLGLSPRHHVEFDDTVILVGGLLRRGVTMTLAGHRMDQHGAFGTVAHVAQDRQQVVQVVAVDRPDIKKAQFLEQRPAGDHAAGEFLGPLGGRFNLARELLGHLLAQMAQRTIGLG